MTWQNGRKLASLKTNDNSITYKYDSNGLRTQKDDKNCTTCYYYDSKNNLIGIHYKLAPVLYFYYDSNGKVTSFSFNNTMYYYVKNLQGDVIKIINQSGTEVVSYTYDAWGKILKQTDSTIYNLANLNPFKYRSYVYDNESGLYYLQSRYYDPVTGRFLNADDTQYIQGNVLSPNLFTYCVNNPISYVDYNGKVATALAVSAIVLFSGALTTAAAVYAYNHSMAVQFYIRAILNEEAGKEYDISNNKLYINKILSSEAYKTAYKSLFEDNNYKDLNDVLETMYHNSYYYVALGTSLSGYANDEKDLKFSIGECQMKMSILLIGNLQKGSHVIRFRIQICLCDEYAFERWDESKSDAFTIFMNNDIGLNLQNAGLTTPYNWFFYERYEVRFKCKHL